jgi:dienelactone hydrolase
MSEGGVCAKCITGFLHEGEPKGTVTSIAGLPTYVAKPVNMRGKPGVIVIVPDVFGWEFINNRLLADAYAEKSGRTIYLPDFMNGLSLFAILPFSALTD